MPTQPLPRRPITTNAGGVGNCACSCRDGSRWSAESVLLGFVPHHQDRAGGVLEDVAAHRAEEHPLDHPTRLDALTDALGRAGWSDADLEGLA